MGRKLIQAMAALALMASTALGIAACGGDPTTPSRRVASQSAELFQTLALMELSAEPETLTRLGLPGELLEINTQGRIGDRSQAAFERLRLRRIEALKLLEEIPLAPEGSALRGHQEMVLRTYDAAVRVGEFGHGRVSLGNAYPYALDHRSGAWIDLPDLLVTRQRISTLDDATHFLRRIDQVAAAMDDERLRLMADAEAGIVPPRFILAVLSERLEADVGVALEDDRIILAFEDQVTGLIDETSETRRELRQRAMELLRDRVRPAQRRLIETAASLAAISSDVPGVWNLPDGDAYYDAVIAVHTHLGTSPENLHREARARVEALTREIETALEALNNNAALDAAAPAVGPSRDGTSETPSTQTVGQRLAELSLREDQIYPNTPEGRDSLERDLDDALQEARTAMEFWIARQPELEVIVRVAAPRTRLASSALYTPPTPDGADPGVLRIDSRDLSRWPRYALPALVLHETVPGHHTEASFAMGAADLPLIRQLMWHTGYGEGWATYAEGLGLEAGIGAEDPLVRIGILQSQMFSAARQVVDTGIHRMRWERQEAIDYLVETTGLPETAMAEEVDRVVVWPGQASSYTAGASQIAAIRARARAVVGRNFDPAAFHYTLLSGGPRPLEQVEADMERWYEAQMLER